MTYTVVDGWLGDETRIRVARANGYAAGYAAGQREMRERAAMIPPGYELAERIRALPINPPPVLSTGEGPAEAGKESDK